LLPNILKLPELKSSVRRGNVPGKREKTNHPKAVSGLYLAEPFHLVELADLTIGCTATNFAPLRGSKPACEPGVKAKKLRRGTR